LIPWLRALAEHLVEQPFGLAQSFLAPILHVIPVQVLAYDVAVLTGVGVDQPRNLAKSVTME